MCSEGYFPTLGFKLMRGRTLSDVDVNGARRVAVVNQALVNKYFGSSDPIGRQIKITLLDTIPQGRVSNPVFEVIGVISYAKNQGIQDPVSPEMFIPYTVTGAFERGILVRTVTDPAPLLNTVRREIWAVDRHVAATLTGTLESYLTQFPYAEPRFSLILLGVFASVGLVLVALGVYSVIACTVSRQTHEIGIRVALGARRADVFGMVIGMGGRLIALGVVIGLAASIGVTRLLRSQLWNISPNDPVTLGAVVFLMMLAGLMACYVPARRATKVDPVIALRYE